MADDLRSLKSVAVFAQQAMREAMRVVGRGARDLFVVSGELSAAKKALATALSEIPEDVFALTGLTRDGRRISVNASAKSPGAWQLTRFDQAGDPLGDTQYDGKLVSIREMLNDIEIATLSDFEGLLEAEMVGPLDRAQDNQSYPNVTSSERGRQKSAATR